MSKTDAFIFIGRSGGGKGTQADLLIKTLKERDSAHKTLYIQTGQELRNFIKGPSFTQKTAHDYYKTDKLQPEFIAIHMWVELLVHKYTGDEHLVFDGTPRRLLEAGVLDSIFSFYGLKKPHVFHLNISEEEALKRLIKRKRLDDAESSVKKRLSWYEKNVAPTVEWYRNNPEYSFHEIDGERSIEEIHAEIVKLI